MQVVAACVAASSAQLDVTLRRMLALPPGYNASVSATGPIPVNLDEPACNEHGCNLSLSLAQLSQIVVNLQLSYYPDVSACEAVCYTIHGVQQCSFRGTS